MEKLPHTEQKRRRSALELLLESEGAQRTERAEKIFSRIARMLVAGELQPKIIPLEKFLQLSGATMEQLSGSAATEGACAILEPGEEERVWTVYMPEGYTADERAKTLLHEALHVLFDPRELEERETVERVGYHEKIYAAEDEIWNILTEKSKKWLANFCRARTKKLN